MTTVRAVLLVSLVGCTGCDGSRSTPEQPLLLRIEPSTRSVAFGQAFGLVVTRSWAEELEPAAFEEAGLAPLVLRSVGSEQRRRAGHVEQTQRYDAYVFQAGKVTVPAVSCTATPKGGGAVVTVRSAPFEIDVAPLDAAGAVELPSDLLPLPPSPWRLAWLLLLLPASVGVWWWRRRTPPPPPAAAVVAPAGPPPDAIALQRLQQLGAARVADAAAVQAFYVEATAAVRDYAAARLLVPAREMTSEELLAATAALAGVRGDPHAALRRFLQQADLVKFAAVAADAAARRDALAHAAEFVTASAAVLAEAIRTRP